VEILEDCRRGTSLFLNKLLLVITSPRAAPFALISSADKDTLRLRARGATPGSVEAEREIDADGRLSASASVRGEGGLVLLRRDSLV